MHEAYSSNLASQQTIRESRKTALYRMVIMAGALGANAVIGVRLETSLLESGDAQLLAYGTAVVVRDDEAWRADRG